MEKIKQTDNLYEYVENYFTINEPYFLRPNHRAPIDLDLRDRMKETSLKQRLDWVRRSEYKKAYSDPFQTTLFSTFDKEELATFLITYDPMDKKEYVESGLFSKMPRDTMQNLFLYNEAMDNIRDYGDKSMLAKEYSKNNSNSIYDFLIQNADNLDDDIFVNLTKNLPTEDQLQEIEYMFEDFFEAYYKEKTGKSR